MVDDSEPATMPKWYEAFSVLAPADDGEPAGAELDVVLGDESARRAAFETACMIIGRAAPLPDDARRQVIMRRAAIVLLDYGSPDGTPVRCPKCLRVERSRTVPPTLAGSEECGLCLGCSAQHGASLAPPRPRRQRPSKARGNVTVPRRRTSAERGVPAPASDLPSRPVPPLCGGATDAG